jgi:CubicO group peptidase (beta-lactamase class C family)
LIPVIVFSFVSLADAQRPLDDIYKDAADMPLLTSLIVAQNGKVIREGYFHGLKAGQSVNVKSVSKSVLSAAIGIAIAEGRLKETDRISDILPAQFTGIGDPVKRRLTVRDFITMTAGLESTSFDNYGGWVNSRDWVRYALQRPFECAPGACMQYSTGNSHILSVVLAKKTGMSARAYMQQKLFAPLGIKLAGWARDPQGNDFGGNEMRFTPRDMLRIGELYRMNGRYNGRQVVPADWIRKSWGEYATSPWNGHRYGYMWWTRVSEGESAGTREREPVRVHFAWGYGGQFIFVVPAKQLVIVATSSLSKGRDPRHLGAVHALADRIIDAR